MRPVTALLFAFGGFAAGCAEEQPTWWGNVRVVGSGEAPVLGGYASAAMAAGGWDDPRELGDCIVLGGSGGGGVGAGELTVRIGADFEMTIPRSAAGYYLSGEIPAGVELAPGLRIEAEADGDDGVPPFYTNTEYPPYLEDVILPDPDAIASREVDLDVSWERGPGGHRLGFTIDDLGSATIACVADDALGSLSVPAELMEAFHPDAGELLVKLSRCAMASVDEDGLRDFYLMACHNSGRKWCREARTLCNCADGEEPPCYAN